MPGQLGPRFALEAAFLILVAVGVGLADFRPLVIILVMAGAWLLVALIEYAASRETPRYGAGPQLAFGRGPYGAAQAGLVEEEIVVGAPPPAPAEEELVVSPPQPQYEAQPEPEERTEVAPPRPHPPEPTPPPAEWGPETLVGTPESSVESADPEQADRDPAGFAAQPEQRTRYRLEPLQPRQRRRFWERWSRSGEPDESPESEREGETEN